MEGKDDAKAFSAEFAKSLMIQDPDFQFDAYKTFRKPKFGNYKEKSLKFVKQGSELTEITPRAYFEAEFTKEKKVLLEVDFGKEDDDYKLLRMSWMPQKK